MTNRYNLTPNAQECRTAKGRRWVGILCLGEIVVWTTDETFRAAEDALDAAESALLCSPGSMMDEELQRAVNSA